MDLAFRPSCPGRLVIPADDRNVRRRSPCLLLRGCGRGWWRRGRSHLFRRHSLGLRGDETECRKDTSKSATYLFWRRHLLDLLVKNRLYPFTHLGDWMIRSIERDTVREDEADVLHELLCVVIPGAPVIGIRLAGVRGAELALDGGEVHRSFDDTRVMWDA